MKKTPFLMVTLAILGGCAGGPDWVNPNLPESRWGRDQAVCQREAERQYGGDRFAPDDRSMLPTTMMDRKDAGRKIDAYVDACMRGKGYFPKAQKSGDGEKR